MSAAGTRSRHDLDNELAGANMFGWIRPTFEVAIRQWQVTLGAGGAAYVMEGILRRLPWPSYERWWVALLHGFVDTLALTLVAIVAYRFLAERERVGSVNEWRRTLIRAVQIPAVWMIGTGVVATAFVLVGMALGAVLGSSSALSFATLGIVALAVPVAAFLLLPFWVSLGVAGALSNVHAVRSLENGLGAVGASLWLALDQKWRVFWPSYLLGVLAIVVYFLFAYLTPGLFLLAILLRGTGAFVSMALAVALMFVLERAYATHLTMGEDAQEPSTEPSAPAPVSPGAAPAAARRRVSAEPAAARARVSAEPAAPLPAGAQEIAALIEQELRANRTQRIVEAVERGLAADQKFFVGYPDSTLALAKKLTQAERLDLSLRVLQTYLKEHRAHRQHLTCALFVGSLLLRAPRRLPDAARFLEQVKKIYPNEPMVDQLIKMTSKALAEAGAGGTA